MDKIKVFTVENVPLKAQEAMDANKAMATTSFLSREGKLTGMSSVYFNKHSAFSSAKELFYSMGHEFVHVSQYAALAGEFAKDVKTLEFKAMLDYHAYNYQNSIGGTVLNGFTEAEIRSATTTYSYLGFMNFSWTFNHSFKYPF